MVHWDHRWPTLARLRNDKDSGSTDKWLGIGRWCHGGIVGCSLPSCVTAIMVEAQMAAGDDDVGGSMDNGVLASSAVPCLLVQRG
jgi:hypothetical protein